MGCSAPVHRRRPCPYCCGGQLWMVTHGFFSCGITGDVVRRLWCSLIGYGRCGCACHRPWARRRWRLMGSSILLAGACGDGRQSMTANAM